LSPSPLISNVSIPKGSRVGDAVGAALGKIEGGEDTDGLVDGAIVGERDGFEESVGAIDVVGIGVLGIEEGAGLGCDEGTGLSDG
jgi:hypothetical protein